MQSTQSAWLQLASDPTTPTTKLEAISKERLSPRVVAALLKNPNISPAVVSGLNPYGAKELLQNPALPLLLLEDPGFLYRLNEYALAGVVGDSGFPKSLLPALASHPSPNIREAVAKRCCAEQFDLLDRLSNDKEERVKLAVLANYYTPQLLIQQMIKSANETVASFAKIRYQHTPTSVLCQIAEGWNLGLRQAVLSCPRYPKEHLNLLLRAGAAHDLSGATPNRTLGHLTQDECLHLARGGQFARELLAAHPQATDASLCLLLQNGSWSIHKILMRRRGLSETVLRALANACSYADIRDVPRSMLPFMAEHSSTLHQESVASRADLPERYLHELIEHCNPHIVRKALCNPKATPEMLLRFYTHPKSKIRAVIARHPSTPVKALVSLLGDAHEKVRGAARKNPKTPRELVELYQLAEQRQEKRSLRLKREARELLSRTPYGRELLRPKER